MPVISDVLCTRVTLVGRDLCVTFPVGQQLCATLPQITNPDLIEVVNALFGQLNAALAPISPILDIIDVVFAIVDCVQAAVDAITQLSPAPLLSCIKGLVQAVNKILAFLPFLWVPILVRDVLFLLIEYVNAVISLWLNIKARLTAFALARLKGNQPGQFALSAVLDCAEENLAVEVQNLNESTAVVDRILGMVNRLLCLIGLPQLPQLAQEGLDKLFDAIDGEFVDSVLITLQTIKDFLFSILQFIPILAPLAPAQSPQCKSFQETLDQLKNLPSSEEASKKALNNFLTSVGLDGI
jgi:hypothetical protein